ncbi:MAG: hypothetical protein KC418_08700 [Anaerolineales bacterium]|nr:hypothetical protein [Anaerolineales bacterium]MCB8950556.1 hypothetical protein [Ardenticatenales bacterium]
MDNERVPREVLAYDVVKLIVALALLGITGMLLLQATGGQAAAWLPLPLLM